MIQQLDLFRNWLSFFPRNCLIFLTITQGQRTASSKLCYEHVQCSNITAECHSAYLMVTLSRFLNARHQESCLILLGLLFDSESSRHGPGFKLAKWWNKTCLWSCDAEIKGDINCYFPSVVFLFLFLLLFFFFTLCCTFLSKRYLIPKTYLLLHLPISLYIMH